MAYVNGGVMATSALALVSNTLLAVTIAQGNFRVSHAHFLTLSGMSLAQMLVGCLSLAHAMLTLNPWASLLVHNTLVGLFASGCVGGSASVIWINWWSLVRIDNAHLPSNRRMSQVTTTVLWLTVALSVVWLQLVASADAGSAAVDGMTGSQRKLRHYLRLYSFMFLASAVWSVFCNVAYIPSVTLTADAFRTGRKRNHECNADCLCSDTDNFSDETQAIRKADEATNTSVFATGQVFNIPTIAIDQHDLVNQST